MDKEILRIDDVAEMLGRSTQTVYRWIRTNRFPHGKKTPSGQLWTRKSILDWAQHGQATKKELNSLASMGY